MTRLQDSVISISLPKISMSSSLETCARPHNHASSVPETMSSANASLDSFSIHDQTGMPTRLGRRCNLFVITVLSSGSYGLNKYQKGQENPVKTYIENFHKIVLA